MSGNIDSNSSKLICNNHTSDNVYSHFRNEYSLYEDKELTSFGDSMCRDKVNLTKECKFCVLTDNKKLKANNQQIITMEFYNQEKRMNNLLRNLNEEILVESRKSFKRLRHEMAQPLSNALLGISMSSEILNSESIYHDVSKFDHDDLQELMGNIYNNLKDLSETIDKFTEMVELESNNVKYEINLKDFLSIFLRSNQYFFKYANVKVDLEIDHDFVIKTQPYLLKIIFRNLFRNSIEHGFKDTKHPRINIFAKDNLIEYYDNGSGIEKDLWDKIFLEGYSSISTDSNEGIGLKLIKEIVNVSLDASIDVVNVPCGTKFRIQLVS